jgi:very-short-patch-repair endonuclease
MLKRRVTDKQRSNARQLRRDMTEAERKLWQLLRSRRLAHVKFRRQVPLGPWIADFVTFEHKVIVEADGSQHYESKRDAPRDLDLATRGFRVLRFWNNDILARPEAVLEQILDALR